MKFVFDSIKELDEFREWSGWLKPEDASLSTPVHPIEQKADEVPPATEKLMEERDFWEAEAIRYETELKLKEAQLSKVRRGTQALYDAAKTDEDKQKYWNILSMINVHVPEEAASFPTGTPPIMREPERDKKPIDEEYVKNHPPVKLEKPRIVGGQLMQDGFPVAWRHFVNDAILEMKTFTMKDIDKIEEAVSQPFNRKSAFNKWLKAEVDAGRLNLNITKDGNKYIYTPFTKEGHKTTYATSPIPASYWTTKAAAVRGKAQWDKKQLETEEEQELKAQEKKEQAEDANHPAPHMKDPNRPWVYASVGGDNGANN